MPGSNPWLAVPLADYEGHMQLPHVDQLGLLSELFRSALAEAAPESVAVLGVAGGNGLEHVHAAVTRRVVGIDISQQYLSATRERFAALPLELHCLNLSEEMATATPVELVHVALVFEHAGTGLCLENALAMVQPAGWLSVVLQLPPDGSVEVPPSSFASIGPLREMFQHVEPAGFQAVVTGRGFRMARESRHGLPAGKAFWHGIFRRVGSETGR